MNDIHYVWVCPKCKRQQKKEMELCPKCCIKLSRQLYNPEPQYKIKDDYYRIKVYQQQTEDKTQNDDFSIDKVIKVLIAINLAVIAYYLIFGFRIEFTFKFI